MKGHQGRVSNLIVLVEGLYSQGRRWLTCPDWILSISSCIETLCTLRGARTVVWSDLAGEREGLEVILESLRISSYCLLNYY